MIDLIKIMMVMMADHCIDNDNDQKGGEATSGGGAGSEKVGGG